MPYPVENLRYIKRHSSSSTRPINKSLSKSIRCNCLKVCNCWRRPETILESRKEATFLEVINKPFIYKFFKDFTNHRKKTNRAVVFSCRPLPQHSLIQGSQMRPSINLENKITLDTYCRVQLTCKKVLGHSSSELPLGYNQDQLPLTSQGWL